MELEKLTQEKTFICMTPLFWFSFLAIFFNYKPKVISKFTTRIGEQLDSPFLIPYGLVSYSLHVLGTHQLLVIGQGAGE